MNCFMMLVKILTIKIMINQFLKNKMMLKSIRMITRFPPRRTMMMLKEKMFEQKNLDNKIC